MKDRHATVLRAGISSHLPASLSVLCFKPRPAVDGTIWWRWLELDKDEIRERAQSTKYTKRSNEAQNN